MGPKKQPTKKSKKTKVPSDENLPALVADALSQVDEPDAELLTKYRSLVGALLYCATQTRPDVAFSVSFLCRAMGKPTPELYEAALSLLHDSFTQRSAALRAMTGIQLLMTDEVIKKKNEGGT